MIETLDEVLISLNSSLADFRAFAPQIIEHPPREDPGCPDARHDFLDTDGIGVGQEGSRSMAELRLAELLAGLSLVTDLAAVHPPEEALRACVLASHMAGAMGLSAADASDVYYTTLLRFVGCTAPMPEYAASVGAADNDIRPRGDMTDLTNPREAFALLFSLGKTIPAWRRPGLWATFLVRGRSVGRVGVRADCEVAARMARRFHLHDSVSASLYQTFERWDGHGMPQGLAKDAIALPARVSHVAFTAVMFHDAGGREAAVDAIRRWSGRGLDPAIAQAFLGRSADLLKTVESEDIWMDALACEPSPQQLVPESRLDEVVRGFADFVDLKSTYLHGHSAGVAVLAEEAARACNLSEPETTNLRRAGFLHDLGRACVATSVWEKRGALTTGEREQVRLHPYHTERVLARSPVLEPNARLAARTNQRVKPVRRWLTIWSDHRQVVAARAAASSIKVRCCRVVESPARISIASAP